MDPFSDDFIAELQAANAEMYKDWVEINPVVETSDGYGHAVQKFPSTGNRVRGSLQPVIRVPGTPEGGGTTTVVGDFMIKLPAGTVLPAQPQKCEFVVNGGGRYQAENVYSDKADRLSTQFYCVRVS